MTEPRIFTLEEANAALPRLRVIIAQQLERAAQIRAIGTRGRGARGSNDADAAALRELMQAYEDSWREVEQMGVVVKDPETGLCDFYGRVAGEIVWLCWKYGEDAVEHYHALDGGFAARKPLDGAVPSRRMYN